MTSSCKYEFGWCAFTDHAEMEVDCWITVRDDAVYIDIRSVRMLNADGVVLSDIDAKSETIELLSPWVAYKWNLEAEDVLNKVRQPDK